MLTFNKLHKLHTYTDTTLIKRTPNEILVYVYARAVLSDELVELRNFPRDGVAPFPISIEVRFPVTAQKEETRYLLAGAEALAQIAAVSPDFCNIFGTPRGINLTELLLVPSREIMKQFAGFDKKGISRLAVQCLSLASTYFYGATSRGAKEGESDWAKPYVSGEDEPYATYNTSTRNVFDRFCIENKYGKFFVTRLAIEDYLSLPHRWRGVDAITRPFKSDSWRIQTEFS